MKKIYVAPITETIVPFQSLLEQDLSQVTRTTAAHDDTRDLDEPGLEVTSGSYTPDAKQGRWDLWDWDY